MGKRSVFLSRIEKLQGQKNYIKYTFINGLSYSFLAETIIYLMAMHFGANNIQLGYISSASYLTGIVIFFVPVLFPKTKIIKLFFVAWLLRGFVSLFYGITLFLPDNLAVIIIIIVYTLYCLLRNVAYPLNHVIQSFITKKSERGSYASKIMIVLYSSMMLSKFISYGALSVFSNNELIGIMILLLVGIILNTGASFAILKVPIKETIQKRNLKEATTTFLYYIKQRQPFLLILLYCGGMSLFVLFNFSIPFLTKEISIPSNIIFIYTTINFLGVILSSKIIRPFLDRFGSKPLLIMANFILIGLSIIWSMSSSKTLPLLLFILGFISMFFIGMVRLLLDRLIVNSIPEDDRFGFTSALAVVFSIISLIVGLGGGFLAEFSSTTQRSLNSDYSLSFILMAVLALFNTIIAILVNEKDSMPVGKSIYSMVNNKQRRTIHNIDKLHRTNNHLTKQLILIEIESDNTNLATQEIQNRLKLPTLRSKEMVIRSLFSNPRPELEKDLIDEALDQLSWWRQSAIFALGAYNSPESLKALQKIFKEKYPYIRSIAAKSLARVGDTKCLKEIHSLLGHTTLDVRTYINLVIASSLIECNGAYWKIIFKLIKDNNSYRFHQSLIIIGTTRLNCSPPISDIFYELNLDINTGFDFIFEELIDLKLQDNHFEELQDYVISEDYFSIWSWCRNRCKTYKLVEPFDYLRKEIISFKKRKIEPTLALAGLYFIYQLELEHNKQMSKLYSQKIPE